MQWVAVSTGWLCGVARGRAGRDHHAYWLSCPVGISDLGKKFAVHKSRKGDVLLAIVWSVGSLCGRDLIVMRRFSL